VDFNNEIKRRVHNVKVTHYNSPINNNMIEQVPLGRNYLVEFNNLKQKKIVPYKVEFNNTKESFKPGQDINDENNNMENENEINDEEQNIENDISPNENQNSVIQKKEVNIPNNLNPKSNMNNKDENQQQIINSPNGQKWFSNQNILAQQNQKGSARIPNVGKMNYQMEQNVNKKESNINNLVNQNPNSEIEGKDFATVIRLNKDTNNTLGQNEEKYTMAETIGYGASDTFGRVNSYKTGGFEVIDNNNIEDFKNLKDIVKETEFQNTFSSAIVNNIVNKPLFSENTLPAKVLPEKVNGVIFYNNVQSLPLIYGGKKVVYQNYNEPSNLYQNTGVNQGFNYMQENYISNMY
jgi:hypothetical protein